MSGERHDAERLLLLDACGETAELAVCEGERVVSVESLPQGRGSAEIVAAAGRLLGTAGWQLAGLDAVGVMSGPGSFTGVRVGLAAAKGLCEAAQLRMIAVSRLQVLAESGNDLPTLAALDAGRGDVYAWERTDDGRAQERLMSDEAFRELAQGRNALIGGERLQQRLGCGVGVTLGVQDALKPVLRRLRSFAGSDVLGDANYVRREGDIYRKPANV